MAGADLSRTRSKIDFDDLAPNLRANGIDATVLVQSEDDGEDNELTMDIASRHSEIAGIVAWAPLNDPPALEATIARLRRSGKLVGIRVLIHNRPDPDWIVRRDVRKVSRYLSKEVSPSTWSRCRPATSNTFPSSPNNTLNCDW